MPLRRRPANKMFLLVKGMKVGVVMLEMDNMFSRVAKICAQPDVGGATSLPKLP
jgi:hypothetical protein